MSIIMKMIFSASYVEQRPSLLLSYTVCSRGDFFSCSIGGLFLARRAARRKLIADY